MACTPGAQWLVAYSADAGGNMSFTGPFTLGDDSSTVQASVTSLASTWGCQAPDGFSFATGVATFHLPGCPSGDFSYVAVQDTCFPSSPPSGGGGGPGDPGTVPVNPNGYGSRGQCFATAQQAGQHLCQDAYPVTDSTEAGSVITSCLGVSSGGLLSLTRKVNEGTPTELTVAPAYGDCVPNAEFALTAELFVVFMAAIAVVWAVKNIALRYVLPQ